MSVEHQVEETCKLLEDTLQNKLLSVILYGSAAIGGLNRYSDIDFLAVVDKSVLMEEKRHLINGLLDISAEIGDEKGKRYIELTIVNIENLQLDDYPPKEEFLYGEWMRGDYKAGFIPERKENPDLILLLAQALQKHKLLYGESLNQYIEAVPYELLKRSIMDALPTLLSEVDGDERNVILTLCRMWLTVETGEIRTKDEAAEWAIRHMSKDAADIISKAEDEYLGMIDISWSDYDVHEVIKQLQGKIKT